jgi:inner membrane protein involved in colicin E2 resistance
MLIMSSDTIFSFQISAINNTNKSIAQNYDVGVTNGRSLYGVNLCDGLWKWNIITNQAEVFGLIPITLEFFKFYLFST